MGNDIEAQQTSEQALPNNEASADTEMTAHHDERAAEAAARNEEQQEARRKCTKQCIQWLCVDHWYIMVLISGGIGAVMGLLYAAIAQEKAQLEGDDWTWRFRNTGMIFSAVTGVSCYLVVFCILNMCDLFVVFLSGFTLVGLVAGTVGLNDLLSGDEEKYSNYDTNILAIDPSRVQWASGLTAAIWFGIFVGCGMGMLGTQLGV